VFFVFFERDGESSSYHLNFSVFVTQAYKKAFFRKSQAISSETFNDENKIVEISINDPAFFNFTPYYAYD
jgi:hypothetical protein